MAAHSTTTPPGPRRARALDDTTTKEMPRFATVLDVADLFDCSDDHVYRLITDGELTAVNIGRRGVKGARPKLRIPLTQVEAYIARHAYTPATSKLQAVAS